MPSEQAEDRVVYKREALQHLFTNVRDTDGYNVLQYAARLASTGICVIKAKLTLIIF